MLGVTKFVEEFFPIFEAEKVAVKYGKRNEMSTQEVLDMWEQKGDESRNRGNYIHEAIEEWLSEDEMHYEREQKEEYRAYEEGAFMALERLKDNYDIYGVEYEIYNEKLTGYIDLILTDHFGNVILADWKTCNEIKYKNRFSKGLDPISDLDDCNFYHYALQLNIYRLLLIESNMFPNKNIKMGLIHIKENDYKFVKVKPTLESHVKEMIRSKEWD